MGHLAGIYLIKSTAYVFSMFCLALACHLFGIVLPVIIAAMSVLRHPVNWRILPSYV
jgi:hypothetical protein